MKQLHAPRPTLRQLIGYGAFVAVNVLLVALGLTRTLHTGFVLGTAGVICCLASGAIFWRHGGHRLTAAGVFSLATLVFVGFAAISWSMMDDFELSAITITATVSIWLATVWLLFWRDSAAAYEHPETTNRTPLKLDPTLGRTLVAVGLVLSITFGIASQFDYFFSRTVFFQLTVGAMALFLCSLLLLRGARWHPIAQLAITVAVAGVAALTIFTAYGRLNLVTLGLIGVVLTSHIVQFRWLKPLILAAVGPALFVFSYMRRRYIEELYGVTQYGIGSVITPLRDAAQLHDRLGNDLVDHDYGQSFFSALIFWVPRAIWEDKPVGFGAVLVDALDRADIAPEGQSWAAVFIAEWMFAGGWIGVLLSVVVIGVLVRLLDRGVGGLVRNPQTSNPLWFLSLVVAIIFVTELANYVWNGSFAYTNRAVLRSATPVLIMIVWFAWNRWRSSRRGAETALPTPSEGA